MIVLAIRLLLTVTIAAVEHYPCAVTLIPLFIAVHTLGFAFGFSLATRGRWRERRAYRAELDKVAQQLDAIEAAVRAPPPASSAHLRSRS